MVTTSGLTPACFQKELANGEAKELICMTHGYELKAGGGGTECWWEAWCRVEWNKGEKKWDDCNGIINKIYLKKKKESFFTSLSSSSMEKSQVKKFSQCLACSN